MSASLVGSEMCIRDRPWPFPWPLPWRLPWLGVGLHSATASAVASALAAVSYTHLTLPTICSV
eukprot:4728473-Alexandrium_andersonii.AAC.1